eukprot:TRINITY_DN29402_c0_g2_i1.p1 TRINITY_DN29402_c0_g2~~TRINITY_DN29402_c0_g2_i1.p1  ORF type:complete len:257 (+),score=39.47 TRINITY_DN29402_c0_g2_i1:85-855(+)
MVIPLGDGGPGPMTQPMVGPPPEYLLARYRKIKACLIVQIFGSIMQLGSGIPLQPSNSQNLIINSLDVVIIIITGIFLLKDDLMISQWHQCLVRTFCATCADQCQGGVPCLCSWFFICFLNVIMALIPSSGSQISIIIAGIHLVLNDSAPDKMSWGFPVRSMPWYILFFTFFASEVILLLAQLIGGWHGYKAFQEVMRRMAEESGGTGADPGVGGGFQGADGDPSMFRQGVAAPPQQRQQPPSFTPFQGGGQRLGS